MAMIVLEIDNELRLFDTMREAMAQVELEFGEFPPALPTPMWSDGWKTAYDVENAAGKEITVFKVGD